MDEKLEQLSELIRKVSNALSHHDKDDFSWLKRPDVVDKLYGENPKCFVTIKGKGRELPFFPLCNRMGVEDPDTIQFAIKMAKKLQGDDRFDSGEIDIVLTKLNSAFNRFNKEIPKPAPEAYKKSMQTKNFNKVKGYLDKLK